MTITEIISAKRDGKELTDAQIRYLIENYARDRVPDCQMSAFAMAVLFQGMSPRETTTLTLAMLESGAQFRWSSNGRPKVDKHSTGGIGDKISIPLAPVLACAGCDVPMISGRGLGPTGGTLDKLESIPGFRTDLSMQEIADVLQQTGCVISGASREIAPADQRFYALRDTTGTVPSIPLITASILSKKLAEGLDALVLDVKCGSGAFMKDIRGARQLADSLVATAQQAGVPTTALITDMDQPLGRMVGNSLEIIESLQVLKGEGPEDVHELTVELACQLLQHHPGGSDKSNGQREQVEAILNSGQALQRFEQMIASQGGDLRNLVEPEPATEYRAASAGTVKRFDCEQLGYAIIELGGGRKQPGDRLNLATGIEVLTKLGNPVEPGQPLYRVYCEQGILPAVRDLLDRSITIAPSPAEDSEQNRSKQNKSEQNKSEQDKSEQKDSGQASAGSRILARIGCRSSPNDK